MLGEHSPISKSVRKKPVAVIECGSDVEVDYDSEVEADSTPKRSIASRTKTPDKFAKVRKRIHVGDKTWEARWHGIITVLPKECLPQVPHGQQNWTITDKNENAIIQTLVKYLCFYAVKANMLNAPNNQCWKIMWW